MAKRQIEIFTAGCSICEPAVHLVQDLACRDCEVTVHDVSREGPGLAEKYEIKTLPAVVVEGALVGCCQNSGPDADQLRTAGIGVPLP